MSATAAPSITVVTDKAKISPQNSPNRPFPLEWTRNIGIAAHIDAGKTTTTERILFYSGAGRKRGGGAGGGTAEGGRSPPVLAGPIAVFDAGACLRPQAETAWRQANKYNVPRLPFINKMD